MENANIVFKKAESWTSDDTWLVLAPTMPPEEMALLAEFMFSGPLIDGTMEYAGCANNELRVILSFNDSACDQESVGLTIPAVDPLDYALWIARTRLICPPAGDRALNSRYRFERLLERMISIIANVNGVRVRVVSVTLGRKSIEFSRDAKWMGILVRDTP